MCYFNMQIVQMEAVLSPQLDPCSLIGLDWIGLTSLSVVLGMWFCLQAPVKKTHIYYDLVKKTHK